MKDSKSKGTVSDEELDFISNLLHCTIDEFHEIVNNATIDGPEKATNLLNILLLADNIHLQADIGDFTLTFEPHAEHSPEENRRLLHLGYPSIIEKNGHSRSHRVNEINGDIRLVETSKELNNIHIENVSETGVELSCDALISELTPGKTILPLEIKFPGNSLIRCKATVVRINHQNEHPRLALRFINIPKEMHELLRSYIYHHSPELEKNDETIINSTSSGVETN